MEIFTEEYLLSLGFRSSDSIYFYTEERYGISISFSKLNQQGEEFEIEVDREVGCIYIQPEIKTKEDLETLLRILEL